LEWNPEPHTQLRFDDVMIFYGETRALRSALKKVTYSNLPRQNENIPQDDSTPV
jgi:hypothetical protein